MDKMTDEARELAAANVKLAHKAAWIYARRNFAMMEMYGWTKSDIESDAMLVLCNAAMRYSDERGKFITYFIAAFQKRMCQRLRSARQLKRAGEIGAVRLDVPIEMADGPYGRRVDLIVDDVPDTADEVAARETLKEAVRSLDPERKRIVQLRAEGLDLLEIAHRIGRSRAHVIRTLRRVREQVL